MCFNPLSIIIIILFDPCCLFLLLGSTNSKPSPPAPFSTFGYKKENKFRAEAKIEVEKVDQLNIMKPKYESEKRQRPYSVQTTKSAPDVIVTHWHLCNAEAWEPYKRRQPRQFLRTSSKTLLEPDNNTRAIAPCCCSCERDAQTQTDADIEAVTWYFSDVGNSDSMNQWNNSSYFCVNLDDRRAIFRDVLLRILLSFSHHPARKKYIIKTFNILIKFLLS